jgi:2-polyprenyl-3-methyl-5-hydroxy-6-metoxy-1,4-benzoquinol methylase
MESAAEVRDHFDAEAARYDFWKDKNWYYYDTLKAIAKRECAGARSVLDAGCGTGGITATLEAPRVVGIDLSPEMIAVAARRHASTPIEFRASDIASYATEERFERILFFDVIEHVADPEAAVRKMRALLADGGRLIITMANPLWEPILLLAEKLGLKMPEGPHTRISSSEMMALAREAGLALVRRDFKLLFPKYIPVFSYAMNDLIGRLPLLRRLAVIEVYVFSPKAA